jgi:hypothetical protein
MTTCPICQHAKRQAMDTALGAGIAPGVISAQYRVPKKLIEHHREHLPAPACDRHAPAAGIASHDALSQARDLISIGPEGITRTGALDDALSQAQDDCSCDWCLMPAYRRLLRAWDEATREEKTRFCLETRTFDVPC